jgi:LysR family hydrogen peroxide-inducible transcriptional activator
VERTSQLTTVEELVALGHGVSLIPQMAHEVDSSDRRIYRMVSNPTPARTIVMVWNPYRFQSHRVESFKECVRNVSKKMAAKAVRRMRRFKQK